MRVEVLKKFRDKQANVIRHKNEIFECTEERFAEICSKNCSLVKRVEEEDSGEDTEPENSGALSEEEDSGEDTEPENSGALSEEEDSGEDTEPGDLAALSKKELQELAKLKGVKGVGRMNREELLNNLK